MVHAQHREPGHELDDEDIHFEHGNGQMPADPSEDAARTFVTPSTIFKPKMVTPDQ